jgi:hypothetical protein
MSKYVLFLLALLASSTSFAATTGCSLQFAGPDKIVYTQANLAPFVENEVRTKLSNSSKTFNIVVSEVCGTTTQSSLTLGIDPENFYVVTVNGKTLTDEQSTYTTANVPLSEPALLAAYTAALNFSSLSLTNQQNAVKTLAYFFAEAARFGDISTEEASLIANTGCVVNWSNYSHLIHRWSVLSKYAIGLNLVTNGFYGGGENQLTAPITDAVVQAYNADAALGKDGPHAKYIDSADFDDPITVQTTCNATTSK